MSGRWHWFPALLLTAIGHLCMLIGYSFLFSIIFLALGDHISELTYKLFMLLFSIGNYGIYFVFSFLWNKATVNRYYQSKIYLFFTFLVIHAGRAFYIYKSYGNMTKADFYIMSFACMASIGLTIDAVEKLKKQEA